MPDAVNTVNQSIEAITDKADKYLTFQMANAEYGIAILKIKEIIGMMPSFPVPQTPAFVKGVINLRGDVIPVIDLRLRFGIPAAAHTQRTCIIVVEITSGHASMTVGMVVDSVSEVLNIKSEDMRPTPTFGPKLNTDYIHGMAEMEGGVKILLDIDKVLGQEELAQLKKAA